MMDEEFDKIMSKSNSDGEWAVLPLTKPSIDKNINEFLGKIRHSFLENLPIPLCAKCLEELRLNEDGNICCIECGMIIEGERSK